MQIERSSGVLLHVSSLPGGRLGPDAYRFVDWLVAAGQSWWALLPLAPPDSTGSPYASPSAFSAHPGFLERPKAPVTADEVEAFVARRRYWIADWAAFAGHGAIADQVRFEREWDALRRYAAERGVRFFGDVPIYVAQGGADVASHPELFQTGFVAAAPPDSLSAFGQRWGNPLYDWPVHRATGFHWWRERFRRTLELVDLTRIDHFRGFVSYWAIPARNSTAKSGRWRPGPGAELFHAVEQELGDLPLIAEDLGHITPPVYALRDELGLPGMVVLLWAFRRRKRNPHNPANYRRNSVAYTSTHDTDTAAGWFAALTPRQRDATGLDPHEPQWGLIELAYASRAALAIAPTQDVLGLGSEARMNRPGRTDGNWRWRLETAALTPALARRLRGLAEQHGRLVE
jgi:4-alpha-glucanotransferase